jgi:hydroxymethylpyrimidine kinase/phosphomethylpyrimidine kinase
MNHIEHHKVFLIAGSEPLGSAGIQADIKSVTACGGYAAGALTCIVNEDTREVKGIISIPVEMVEGQCRSFLGDVGADCIKTGMLYSRDVIHAVAQILKDFSSVPCVVDPVMVSTAGARLLKDDAIECYKNELFAHATIITPNRREAEVLLGRPMNPRNMKADLRALCTNGNAVIVKSIGEAEPAVLAVLLLAFPDLQQMQVAVLLMELPPALLVKAECLKIIFMTRRQTACASSQRNILRQITATAQVILWPQR